MSEFLTQVQQQFPEVTTQAVPGQMTLEELFAGEENEELRTSIIQRGAFRMTGSKKELRIQTRKMEDGRHEILALAALSRDPGLTDDYLTTVQDFGNVGQKATLNLTNRVKQYKEIYKHEGIVNNAINKVAALIGTGGRFKVRRAKKGKSRKSVADLQAALDYFTTYANSSSADGVVTSERGLRSIVHAGVRQALVEGDWVARHMWSNVKVHELGQWSLPMLIQTISLVNLEPVGNLSGLGELWYWRPDSDLMQLLQSGSTDKSINDVVKRLVDNRMLAELKKNQRVLLTPALLMHVKYRGFATDAVGESMIEPAKAAIRYSRGLTAVDLVSMENIINRLTIVQVGSADPKSPYSKPDVAAARAALMQSFFEESAPSMVIVWQGDDVSVKDVGSQDSVLALDKRYEIADHKIKSSIGLPDALLLGVTGDGSTAQWASVLGAAAQMQELANSFATVLTQLGERIAAENGFDDVDLLWEFDKSLFTDEIQTRTQNRADYALGLVSIQTMLAAAGRDPQAEFYLKCQERGLDPNTATFEEVFTPPQGLQGQAPGGIQGQGEGKVPGEGRRPDSQNTQRQQEGDAAA